MLTVSYIDDDRSLEPLLDSPADRLMVDTEFLREKTYFPKLCLVQVATRQRIWLIDPLGEIELAPLWQRLDESELVLHAARQDLEVMSHTAGRLPGRVFDTQIAAGIVGQPPQIGYANLVEDLTGTRLDKSHTRTNWTRRPLSRGELDYAADDVRYLGELHAQLTERLLALGRLDWAREDSAALLAGELYAPDPATAWQRVRGIGRLPQLAFARAAALAEWREREAVRRDLPRQWLVKDDELLALASADDPAAELARGPWARRRDSRKLSEALRGADVDRQPPGGKRPSPEEQALTRELALVVRAVAAELEIEPEVLAPQKELRAAVAGRRDLRVFRGWRRALAGDALLERLGGSAGG